MVYTVEQMMPVNTLALQRPNQWERMRLDISKCYMLIDRNWMNVDVICWNDCDEKNQKSLKNRKV